MKQNILPILVLLVLVEFSIANLAAREPSQRHPVSVINAKAFIGKDRMSISFEIVYADDLELFHGLEVDPKTQKFDEEELADAIDTHGEFLQKNVQVIDSEGKIIKSRLIDVIDIEIPEEGLPAGSLMEHSLMYTFEYKFEKPPEFLSFRHTIDDSEFPNPVEIDITLRQSGVGPPYPRFGLRFNQPQTRDFKWEGIEGTSQKEIDDWLVTDTDPELVGVEGFSSTFSFIYITNYEVRHELLIPLSSLDTMFEIPRKNPLYLEVEEQDAIESKVKELFTAGNPVTIDGQVVIPKVDRIDFFDLRTRDFGATGIRKKVSMINGRVGIILSYSTKGVPDEIQVKWEMFFDSMKEIDSVVIAFEDVSRFHFARFKSAEFKEVDENVYVWKNSGQEDKPQPQPIESLVNAEEKLKSVERGGWWISLGCLVLFGLGLLVAPQVIGKTPGWFAGLVGTCFALALFSLIVFWIPQSSRAVASWSGLGPKVNEDEAKTVFEKLHRNMFRAFDYRNEEDIYDSLSASVDGKLLGDLFLDIRRSLIVQDQGGAVSNIDEVQYVGGELTEPIKGQELESPGFAFRCKWNLLGSVEHWAHVHQRTIQYEAIFHVEVVDGQWKITRQKIVNEDLAGIRQWRRKITKKQ